jgi:hypothetical protein
MMKKWVFFLMGVVPVFSQAHPGRTDAEGCHVEKRTGERHCHQPKYENHDDSLSLPSNLSPSFEFATEFNARLSFKPGKSVASHIDSLGVYLYEWEGVNGFRIFSEQPPIGYAEEGMTHGFVVRVYGKNGVLLDDGSTQFEEGLRLQKKLHAIEKRLIDAERDELQKKIDRGVVDIGMSEFEVILILGYPASRLLTENGEVLDYERRMVLIKEDKVVAVQSR